MVAWAGFNAILGQVAGLYHDDGIYPAFAKSLAEGEGYNIASLPTMAAQTKYPFLYSVILSWSWKVDQRFPETICFC
jgi:hypothetical protein